MSAGSSAINSENPQRGEWDDLFDRFFCAASVPPLWRLPSEESASGATLWGILVHTLTDLNELLRDTECEAEIESCRAQCSAPPSVSNVRMAVEFCPPLRQLMETFMDAETCSFYLSHIDAADGNLQGAASAAFAFFSGWSADVNNVPGDADHNAEFWTKLFSVLSRCAQVSPTDSDALQRALFTAGKENVTVFKSTVDLLGFAMAYSGSSDMAVSEAHLHCVNLAQDVADVQQFIAAFQCKNQDVEAELHSAIKLKQHVEGLRARWLEYRQTSMLRVQKTVERIVFICEYGNWGEWLQTNLQACCTRAQPASSGEAHEARDETSSSDDVLRSIERVLSSVDALSEFLSKHVDTPVTHRVE